MTAPVSDRPDADRIRDVGSDGFRGPPVAVVDHGAGNLASVRRALRRAGADAFLTSDPDRVAGSDRIVLPGDGHFGEAMRALRNRGLEAPLKAAVSGGGRLLGICVGLQMLFAGSEEEPGVAGLGLLPGTSRRFDDGVRAPHIGWNQLEDLRPHPLFASVPEGGYAYFLHGYRVEPLHARHVLARTDYGGRFASAAGDRNVAGIQFHPEKSGRLGARVLANFVGLE